MQKWEYGYMYVVTAWAAGTGQQFIVVSDARGNQIVKDVSDELPALNFLGAQGWIIAESPYMNWQLENRGWRYDLIKREKSEIQSVQVSSVHFMRKPQS